MEEQPPPENYRSKENTPMRPDTKEQNLKAPLTPFRRNRSRIFYASEASASNSSEHNSPSERHSPKDKLQIKVSTPSNTLMRRSKINNRSLPSSTIHEVVSSADKATGNCCSEEHSPACSPAGSWRGSDRSSSHGSWRGSPSQRSQDSGYSDSGESNTGCHNEAEEILNQPPVRHVTRVYFGDYNNEPNACEEQANSNPDEVEPPSPNVPKTSYNEISRLLKIGKRRSISVHSPHSVNTVQTPNILNSSYESNTSVASSNPKSISSSQLDDGDDSQLEHKSLSNITTSTPQPNSSNKKLSQSILKALFIDQRLCLLHNDESNRKTTPNSVSKTSSRNYRKVSQGKRSPRRSKSNDKLLDQSLPSIPRRQEPLKARRRWSSSDLDRCQSPPEINSPSFHEEQSQDTPQETLISRRRPISMYSLPQMPISPFKNAQSMGNSSLEQWLGELRLVCASECLNTLQSKSLHAAEPPPPPLAASTHDALASIQKRAHVVSAEFALLCQRLEDLQLEQVPTLVTSLAAYVQTFIQTHCADSTSDAVTTRSKSSLKHQVRVVDQICARLTDICSSSSIPRPTADHATEVLLDQHRGGPPSPTATRATPQRRPRYRVPTSSKFECEIVKEGEVNRDMIREIVQIVTALGHAFTKLVDILLSHGMKTLVNILEEDTDMREVESAVSEVTELGVNGGHVCRLVGRVGGIRALLGVCVEPRFKRIRPLALRALATVCCVTEGISFFEKEGGVGVIAEVLCDPSCPEEERSEAAGVLAQITSPWVEGNHSLPCLRGHMTEVVTALTELASSTSSAEVFLLTSAALANLTFLDASAIHALLASSTHLVLLEAAQTEDNLSVFTKDQIATILANMSSTPLAAKKLVEADGIEVLLALLQTGPADSFRLAEVAATERVQQKSAIALSRLSTDPAAANQVLELGGAARLVHLCKNERERNHSDAVLVACLAALRKMAACCGEEELRQVDASELVEPRLLDSFLIYSSQQESYV